MAKPVKKTYETLRKKYKLPTYEELDSEFEVSEIEDEKFSLREVRKKVVEKLSDTTALVEQTLQPDTNLADLYESRVLDEAEKKRVFEVYKKLMAAIRRSSELALESDEKADAQFIKSFCADWKKIKPEVLEFIRKLRESWEKDTDEGESAGYMG